MDLVPFYGNSGKKGRLLVTMDVKAKQLGSVYHLNSFLHACLKTKSCLFPEYILINLDRNLELEILRGTCVYGDLTHMHILTSPTM